MANADATRQSPPWYQQHDRARRRGTTWRARRRHHGVPPGMQIND
jgi:hypothetical protein